jgi:hypothetical protein
MRGFMPVMGSVLSKYLHFECKLDFGDSHPAKKSDNFSKKSTIRKISIVLGLIV